MTVLGRERNIALNNAISVVDPEQLLLYPQLLHKLVVLTEGCQ